MNYGEVLHALSIDLQSFFRRNIKLDGASFSQTMALVIIPDEGIEMSSLSKRLGLDTSTVTRLIIGLEKKAWVIRKITGSYFISCHRTDLVLYNIVLV